MKWIDMHCDTLSEIIRQRKELKTNDLCADLERLLRGGAGAQFFACFVNAARYGLNTKDADEKMIWDQAYRNVLSMIGRAKREQNERFEIAVEPEMIQRQLWAETDESEILYGILTVEEGGVLNGRMERLGELYDRGVRLMTLTWNSTNCIGSPNSRNPAVMEKGLTLISSQSLFHCCRRGGRRGKTTASLVRTEYLQQRFGISAAEHDLARGIEMRVVFIAQRGQPP